MSLAYPISQLMPCPGEYIVQPLSSVGAGVFHDQVQALAPTATATTFGGTATRLFASLTTQDGQLLAYADGAEADTVLADLRQQLPDPNEERLLAERTA